jgi:multiple sugar transport system substrate-binding protein
VRRPRWSFLALTASTSLVVAACGGVGGGGGSADSGSSGAAGTAGPATITTMGFSLPDEVATVRVDRFKKANAQITIKINEGAFDEQQFLSAVAGGNPPDLVYLDRETVGSYAARGAITPLDDCVSSQSIDLDTVRPPALDQVEYDGKVYGIPEFQSVRVLLVNTKASKQGGATVSTADWDALQQWAVANNRKSGGKFSRIGFDPKIPEFLPLWAQANGGSVLSDDGTKAQLDSPEVVEALKFTTDLVEAEGGFADLKAFRDSADFFGAKNQFAADQLGAMPMEDWYLNVLAEVSPNAPVAVKAFEDRQGEPITYATGQAWAIPKGADEPEAACRFMKSMTEVDAWVAAAQERVKVRTAKKLPFTGLWTGNADADRRVLDEVYKPSGTTWLDEGVTVIADLQDKAFSLPPTPAGAEVKKAWTDATNDVLAGKATAQEALAQAQKEAQAALDKAQS